MQIQLVEDELEVAVRDYIKKMGISRPVGNINFTATRGENAGILTTVEVEESEAPVVADTVAKRAPAAKAPAAKKVSDISPAISDKDAPVKSTTVETAEALENKEAAPTKENSIFG